MITASELFNTTGHSFKRIVSTHHADCVDYDIDPAASAQGAGSDVGSGADSGADPVVGDSAVDDDSVVDGSVADADSDRQRKDSLVNTITSWSCISVRGLATLRYRRPSKFIFFF